MGTAGHSRHSTDQRDGRAQLPSRAALRMVASLAATSPGRAAPRERGRAAGASPAPLGRPLGPGDAVPAAACFRLSPMRDGRAARYAGAPGTTYPESRARRSPGRRPSTPSPTRSPARSRHRPGSPRPSLPPGASQAHFSSAKRNRQETSFFPNGSVQDDSPTPWTHALAEPPPPAGLVKSPRRRVGAGPRCSCAAGGVRPDRTSRPESRWCP